MAHPVDLVARIKGALRLGLRPKQLAYLTGIPVDTIKEWSARQCRDTVNDDARVADDIRDALLGKFEGRMVER
jgi:hypothetical protein